MSDIIPSIYDSRPIGSAGVRGTVDLGNVRLRTGEVKKTIPPDAQENRNKDSYEYEVLVQIMTDGGITTKMYHHCQVMDSFGSLADFSTYTLRESDQQNEKYGNGSKVLLLCVDGNDARAYIVGGERRKKDLKKGHHYEFEFNGVNVAINDDGSWEVTNKGKTSLNGGMDPNADKDGAGTKVKVQANGNFSVETAKGQSITIDHKAGTIKIDSENELKLIGNNVNIKATKAVVDSSSTEIKGLEALISTSITKLGGSNLIPGVNGVVTGTDIDPVTKLPLWMLGMGSSTVLAKK